jgi:carboxyl-terminal processing protease
VVAAAAAVLVAQTREGPSREGASDPEPSATLVAAAGSAGSGGAVAQESVYEALEVFNGALMLIRDQYLEPVDPAFLMDGAVRGIFEALDADSTYLSAEELARYRNREALPASVGVGLQKRYYLHVDDVLPGSPAAAAGIERGVAITAINRRNTRELRIPVALLMLAGEPGTSVELSLRDATDAESRTVILERAVLADPPVEHRVLDEGVGLVRIRRFHEETPSQLAAAIGSLRDSGADSLVLDLRGSRGGDCAAGAEAAGAFADGELARLVERRPDGEEMVTALEPAVGQPLFDGPLTVVVNRSTVCPGEVLAAALKSGERADVVGRRTAGRTGRQEVIELPEGDAILLSTAHVRGVDGEDILGVGVTPSVGPAELEVEPDDLDDDDPELDLAIRALQRRRAAAGESH